MGPGVADPAGRGRDPRKPLVGAGRPARQRDRVAGRGRVRRRRLRAPSPMSRRRCCGAATATRRHARPPRTPAARPATASWRSSVCARSSRRASPSPGAAPHQARAGRAGAPPGGQAPDGGAKAGPQAPSARRVGENAAVRSRHSPASTPREAHGLRRDGLLRGRRGRLRPRKPTVLGHRATIVGTQHELRRPGPPQGDPGDPAQGRDPRHLGKEWIVGNGGRDVIDGGAGNDVHLRRQQPERPQARRPEQADRRPGQRLHRRQLRRRPDRRRSRQSLGQRPRTGRQGHDRRRIRQRHDSRRQLLGLRCQPEAPGTSSAPSTATTR